MAYCIYTLSDPRDGKIRYIGMSKDPYRRYGSHLTTAGDPYDTPRKAWIEDLLNNEQLPILAIIERIEDRGIAYIRESELIEDYLDRGIGIVNTRKNLISAKNRQSRLIARKKELAQLIQAQA